MLIGTILAALTFTTGVVETPWGAGKTLGEKKALSETTVCSDGKGHYLAVAPHEIRGEQIFYGNQKSFSQVPLPGPSISGNHFFEPRFINPGANSDFRGVDMRVYSSVEADKEKKTCQLSCGKRTVDLTVLEPDKAKEILLGAKYEENVQHFLPHALLRDTKGTYYLVEKSVRPGEEQNFQLWVGQKGKMKQEKMMNVVADSEGEVFSTKGGELRLLIDRVQPSFWIQSGKKTELRAVPVQDNWGVIFNELGVYRGARLGTPCDDI